MCTALAGLLSSLGPEQENIKSGELFPSFLPTSPSLSLWAHALDFEWLIGVTAGYGAALLRT